MAGKSRPLELETLCARLHADFDTLIAGRGSHAAARESNFFTRALLAFVLMRRTGAAAEDAVAAIVDGGGDHGLDAVHVGLDNTIWLLQSKYIESGEGEPIVGEVHKFCDAVRDLLRHRWARFNDAVNGKKDAVTRAMKDLCRVQVLLVHTGGAISDDRRDLFADLKRDFNTADPDFLSARSYGLSSLHELHLEAHAGEPIDEKVTLRNYGLVDLPYRAVYGRISTQRLAELFAVHGDRLVASNIRRYKGSTLVNDGMVATLRDRASDFFYFNNGVTFLCDSFAPVDARHTDHATGHFRVRGLSVINGAQTVGTIAFESPAFYESHPSEVLATFVSTAGAPVRFGDEVTRKRNCQNAVDLEDFAALDERQIRWGATLALADTTYVVQQGDGDALYDARTFGIREAARALACGITGNGWEAFVVAAKADRRLLFKTDSEGNDGSSPYLRVFADFLTAKDLWRTVQLGRLVDEALRARAAAEGDPVDLAPGTLRARDVLREGRWLALHVLLVKTGLRGGEELYLTQDERTRVSVALDTIADSLIKAAQAQTWTKHARAVFENRADCAALNAHVMQLLASQTL